MTGQPDPYDTPDLHAWYADNAPPPKDTGQSELSPRQARRSLRMRAAAHEVRCAECRVSWRSWWQRLTGATS